MTLVSIRGMSKQYAGTNDPALNDVDLNVRRGERIAVLGLSGAGKSTLIRCLNRLVEPTAGDIVWYGEQVDNSTPSAGPAAGQGDPHDRGNTGDPRDTDGVNVRSLSGAELRAYRRRIGMVFQEFHLVDRLTVIANVLTGRFGHVGPWQAAFGRYSQADIDAAYDALARVGLSGYEQRKARELSGGQRQRVAIARALVQRPLLLLGDEPVSNLDPMTARGVIRLLAEINERDGLTMVVNLHSVELAIEFAQRVIGMNDGRIVFDDSPARLDDEALHEIYSDGSAESASPHHAPWSHGAAVPGDTAHGDTAHRATTHGDAAHGHAAFHPGLSDTIRDNRPPTTRSGPASSPFDSDTSIDTIRQ